MRTRTASTIIGIPTRPGSTLAEFTVVTADAKLTCTAIPTS
jgi:hypothetical protein